jgi:hypothetical protein
MQSTLDSHRESSLVDLLAIQTLRVLENDEPRFVPTVDVPIAGGLAPNAMQDTFTLEHVLADRADQILRDEYGAGKPAINAIVKTVRLGLLAFVLFITVGATTLCGRVLLAREADDPVNIVGFAGFLGLNLLMAIPPVLLMIAGLIPHGPKRRQGTRGTIAGILEDLGNVASAVYWVLEWAISRVSRKLARQSERSVNATQATSAAGGKLLLRAAAFTSHLCWTIVCGIVLISFLYAATFHAYDFTWDSTLVDQQSKLPVLQTIAAPISNLPFVVEPDDGLAKYLSAGKDQKAPMASEFREKERRACATLMASLLLYYGLLPRAILALLAFVQLRLTVRTLHPSPTSPYFAAIIGNLTTVPIDTSSKPAEPTSTPQTSWEPPPTGTNAAVPHQLPPSSQPCSTPRAVVFSYEVSPPKDGWASALNLKGDARRDDLGNAEDRASRQRIVGELERDSQAITSVMLVVDLIGSPDNQFMGFVRSALTPLSDSARAASIALLSGGERLRRKFSDDAEPIRTRVLLWRQEIVKCGIHEENVFEFDHASMTAGSRQVLLNHLKRIGKPSNDVQPSGRSIRLGGRFAQARTLISAAANSISSPASPDQLAAKTKELHQQLHELYGQEPSMFSRSFAQVKGIATPFGPGLDTVSAQASAGLGKLREGAEAIGGVGLKSAEQVLQGLSSVVEYAKGLDFRWGGAFALAALAAPFLAGAGAITAAGAATVAGLGLATGIHVPMITKKLARLIPGMSRKTTEAGDGQPDGEDFGLDDLVRTAVVWALVLELQGNSQDVIVKALQRVLAGCYPDVVDSPDKAQALLNEVTERLRTLAAVGSV